MNEAIRLAIEKGGWKATQDPGYVDATKCVVLVDNKSGHKEYMFLSDVVLDPLFWQALGKALGWVEFDKEQDRIVPTKRHWKVQALKYFDLVLTGGDSEKFWQSLLERR